MADAGIVEVLVTCSVAIDPSGDPIFCLMEARAGDVVVRYPIAEQPSHPHTFLVSAHQSKDAVLLGGSVFARLAPIVWTNEEDDLGNRFPRTSLSVPVASWRGAVEAFRAAGAAIEGEVAPHIVVAQELPNDRNRQLAAIHVLKKEAGLDDDTYRDLLQRIARARSSKDLDERGRRLVIEELRRLAGRTGSARPAKSTRPHNADQQPRIDKIGALLAEQKLSWEYAHGIGKQMFRRERLQWLNDEQLRAVITALVKRGEKLEREREAAESANPTPPGRGA